VFEGLVFEGLAQYFWQRSATQLARDVLDIVIVYYVTYRVLLLVKGTRAQQIAIGLLFVLALYVAAQVLQLVAVLSILGSLITSFILVVVVVFQGDIRRGLMRMGSRAWLPSQVRAQESAVIDEVVEAATELARHRIGAIITFEQDANLDDFVGINKGKVIDAAVSSELLVSLFVPEGMNKLHDGAVILRNLRIAKAGVFFPMPEGKVLDQHFGSRHRAAVGITEETDAVVVVVSEERGTISCCFNGNIAPDLNGARLKEMLEGIFNPRPRTKKRATARPSLPATPAPERPSAETSDTPTLDLTTLPRRLELSGGRPSRILEPEARNVADSRKTEDHLAPFRQRAPAADEPAKSERAPLRARNSLTDLEPVPRSEPPPRPRHGSDPPPPLRPRPSVELDARTLETRKEPPARTSESLRSEPPPPLRPRVNADVDSARRSIPGEMLNIPSEVLRSEPMPVSRIGELLAASPEATPTTLRGATALPRSADTPDPESGGSEAAEESKP
jgi:uncharacterized protein (TIGR00159 family)